MKELETRIIDIDVEKIRETLNKLGAKNVKRENHLFLLVQRIV